MSRRPNPAADRAAQNQQTLKSLVKLESNKSCADCKRNKHPRWASWNLGVFVCIRCSGIHRGMGTHISRVKSVDLDSWTDEQLQNMLRWGNARANKYWEAKLAPGHVPSEAKIESFIRTKYESKRWVMDGGIPDPSTLGTDGDDNVPLNVVQDRAKLDRSASQRISSTSSHPSRQPAANIDLFGDDEPAAPAPPRPSTTEPSITARPGVPPKAEPAPPKQTKAGDSLLGLDFFGSPSGATSPPSRPASTASAVGTTTQSRPDLKQSILSLYASKPATAPSQPHHQPSHSGSFGGMGSPQHTQPPRSSGSPGGLNDAFSSLSMTPSSPPQQQPAAKPDHFAGLTGAMGSSGHRQTPSSTSAFGSGGSFFDSISSPAPPAGPLVGAPVQKNRTFSSGSGFGDFSSTAIPAAPPAPKPASSGFGGMSDLVDLNMSSSSGPAPPPPQPSTAAAPKPPTMDSPFNLSKPKPAPPQQTTATAVPSYTGFSNMDAWGSNDAWGSPDPAPTAASAATPKSPPPPPKDDSFGWGSSAAPTSSHTGAGAGWGSGSGSGGSGAAHISADEDFGGWASAAPAPAPTGGNSTGPPAPPKPVGGGFGGNDDLFSNVWE
ncbi:hypothetical protein BDY21DRAFT_387914 [Lineolata rhizophorae]|uniref:Arf-GAP domain-containing protein n=1 Tax=Lineolata rhizophorae TaxID=578093 RepID=A0A6A6NQB2_9PEZI|nr:hypothetical protein BDY21DRAFT_387914 [Lineolata rhizophorae]